MGICAEPRKPRSLKPCVCQENNDEWSGTHNQTTDSRQRRQGLVRPTYQIICQNENDVRPFGNRRLADWHSDTADEQHPPQQQLPRCSSPCPCTYLPASSDCGWVQAPHLHCFFFCKLQHATGHYAMLRLDLISSLIAVQCRDCKYSEWSGEWTREESSCKIMRELANNWD